MSSFSPSPSPSSPQSPPAHPLQVGRTYTLHREGRISHRTVLAVGPQSEIAPHKRPHNGTPTGREEGLLWVLYRTTILSPVPRKGQEGRTELVVERSCSAVAFRRWVVKD